MFLPGQDEDYVWRSQADKNAVGRALHLGSTQDKDGEKVANQPQGSNDVEQDTGQEKFKEKTELFSWKALKAWPFCSLGALKVQ